MLLDQIWRDIVNRSSNCKHFDSFTIMMSSDNQCPTALVKIVDVALSLPIRGNV